jgi:hypothetical protein
MVTCKSFGAGTEIIMIESRRGPRPGNNTPRTSHTFKNILRIEFVNHWSIEINILL